MFENRGKCSNIREKCSRNRENLRVDSIFKEAANCAEYSSRTMDVHTQTNERLENNVPENVRKSSNSLRWRRVSGLSHEPTGSGQRATGNASAFESATTRIPCGLLVKRVLFVTFLVLYIICFFALLAAILVFVWLEPVTLTVTADSSLSTSPHPKSSVQHSASESESLEAVREGMTPRRISGEQLIRANETLTAKLVALTGGSGAHELFIADLNNNAVRVFDLRAHRLEPHDVYRIESGERVCAVAYSSESDSLFVATLKAGTASVSGVGGIIRSLARTNASNGWSLTPGMMSFEGRSTDSTGGIRLRVLSDGHLFWGQRGTDEVHVCNVSVPPNQCIQFTLPAKHMGFDVQLVGNETRLAAAFDGQLVVFRASNGQSDISQMSYVNISGVREPLFCRENVLVVFVPSLWMQNNQIKSYSTTGDLQLLNSQNVGQEFIGDWCCVNGTLYARDLNSDALLLYEI